MSTSIMAWLHLVLDEHDKACGYYDKTVEAYEENIRRNPDARPITPRGAGTITQYVNNAKRGADCP